MVVLYLYSLVHIKLSYLWHDLQLGSLELEDETCICRCLQLFCVNLLFYFSKQSSSLKLTVILTSFSQSFHLNVLLEGRRRPHFFQSRRPFLFILFRPSLSRLLPSSFIGRGTFLGSFSRIFLCPTSRAQDEAQDLAKTAGRLVQGPGYMHMVHDIYQFMYMYISELFLCRISIELGIFT